MFVRVRLSESGREVSLSAAFVAGLPEGAVEVIDAPAIDSRGRPRAATREGGRPLKPRTTVQKEAAKKAASVKAASSTADVSDPVDVVDNPPKEASK